MPVSSALLDFFWLPLRPRLRVFTEAGTHRTSLFDQQGQRCALLLSFTYCTARDWHH